MGKGKHISAESKMVGTVSNKMKSMSEKERTKRRINRLNQCTDNEKLIMAKYGKSWEQQIRDINR